MEYRGRTPNKAIARAKLDEGKRQLDAMRTRDLSAAKAATPSHQEMLRDLDEQYEILKQRSEASFSGSDDKVASLAADLERTLEDWSERIGQMWKGLAE